MRVGERVKFTIYDDLFKVVIHGAGLLTCNVFGRLWMIKPDTHERLSGIDIQVHEDYIGVAV